MLFQSAFFWYGLPLAVRNVILIQLVHMHAHPKNFNDKKEYQIQCNKQIKIRTIHLIH